MKYILLCLSALVICLILGWIPARIIGKKRHFRKMTTIGLMLVFSILLIAGISLGYLSVYYHADESAQITNDVVKMEKIDGGYLFDGPGEKDALIFYPGAKVEATAYAPLLTAISEKGVDCFLADMPFRMAMFGSNKADHFLKNYQYDSWTAAGHSMGGLVIAGYAADHPDVFSHLILLASYPGKKIPDSIDLCSIYGTKDGCLNRKSYEEAKKYWPASFFESALEGGNHAGYANYGPQSGDGQADITREEQQAQTIEIIGTFLL